LIRALQLNPCILLLDEPTAALDPETTQQFETLIQQWFQPGQGQPSRALIWTSHDPAQVERMTTQQLNLAEYI
jgi:putative ABC transport system ATP-binding protein